MAITVGQELSLAELLNRSHLDQTNYIERLQVREYRKLVHDIDRALSENERYKQDLIALKEHVQRVANA